MTTHHCGTYPTSPYCHCYNQTGEDKYHYKQFDLDTQTYNCCDRISASVFQLKGLPETNNGADPLPQTLEFFQSLGKTSFSACCYQPYLTNPDTGSVDVDYFRVTYKELYHNYIALQGVFNNFIAGTSPPVMNGNNVQCADSTFPFILSYRAPNETYYNYTFICSDNTNGVFSNQAVAYGNLDYKVTRFHDNQTGQPCISSSCQLITDNSFTNYGDLQNQGNNSPVYDNNPNPEKGGLIASGVLAVLLFLLGIYVFYIIHKKIKVLEDRRLQ